MNVTLKKVESNDSKGGQTRTHSLVASKSFKAGDVIYTVRDGIRLMIRTAYVLEGISDRSCSGRRRARKWNALFSLPA